MDIEKDGYRPGKRYEFGFISETKRDEIVEYQTEAEHERSIVFDEDDKSFMFHNDLSKKVKIYSDGRLVVLGGTREYGNNCFWTIATGTHGVVMTTSEFGLFYRQITRAKRIAQKAIMLTSKRFERELLARIAQVYDSDIEFANLIRLCGNVAYPCTVKNVTTYTLTYDDDELYLGYVDRSAPNPNTNETLARKSYTERYAGEPLQTMLKISQEDWMPGHVIKIDAAEDTNDVVTLSAREQLVQENLRQHIYQLYRRI